MNILISLLHFLKGYASLLSFCLALIAFIVTLVNNHNTKKRINEETNIANERYNEQKEQYETRLAEEKARREEDKRIADDLVRINEQPYLVFKKIAKIKTIPSASGDLHIYSMTFLNKGRGSAYNIVPDVNWDVSVYGKDFTIYRYGAVEDPIAMVNEVFEMKWAYTGDEVYGYRMTFLINYDDSSGRKYYQKYELDIISETETNNITYATPELREK